jgi:hypothetical protein
MWQDLQAMLSGPGHMRFLIQPLVAVLLGLRDGKLDVEAGKPPFALSLWASLGPMVGGRGLLTIRFDHRTRFAGRSEQQVAQKRDNRQKDSSRQILPIPDRQKPGITTFDAKDPNTSFPAIEPLRAPEVTLPFVFSADETADVGRETGTPVTDDYNHGTSVFSGRIHWVQLDAGPEEPDHFIDSNEHLRIALARQ